jgi:hypothetical protein
MTTSSENILKIRNIQMFNDKKNVMFRVLVPIPILRCDIKDPKIRYKSIKGNDWTGATCLLVNC